MVTRRRRRHQSHRRSCRPTGRPHPPRPGAIAGCLRSIALPGGPPAGRKPPSNTAQGRSTHLLETRAVELADVSVPICSMERRPAALAQVSQWNRHVGSQHST